MGKIVYYQIHTPEEYKQVRKELHQYLVEYFAGDQMLVDLALFEAVSNAWQHGNKRDEKLKIQIKLHFLSHSMITRIKDEGKGFTWQKSNGSHSGQGLRMIGQIMDHVIYSEKGNEILMRKWVKV